MNYPGATYPQEGARRTMLGWEDNDKTPRPTYQPPMTIRDFYPDTHFNSMWMQGPNTSTFTQDRTIVRPETSAYYRQGPTSAYDVLTPEYLARMNKAIMEYVEYDEADFKEVQARELARIEAVKRMVAAQEELMYRAYYGHPQRLYTGQAGVPGPNGAPQQAIHPSPPAPPTQEQ